MFCEELISEFKFSELIKIIGESSKLDFNEYLRPCKEYINKYIIRVDGGFLFWNPVTKKITYYTTQKFERIIFNRKIEAFHFDLDGEIDHEKDLTKWLLKETKKYYRICVRSETPLIFQEDSINYVNLFKNPNIKIIKKFSEYSNDLRKNVLDIVLYIFETLSVC